MMRHTWTRPCKMNSISTIQLCMFCDATRMRYRGLLNSVHSVYRPPGAGVYSTIRPDCRPISDVERGAVTYIKQELTQGV